MQERADKFAEMQRRKQKERERDAERGYKPKIEPWKNQPMQNPFENRKIPPEKNFIPDNPRREPLRPTPKKP